MQSSTLLHGRFFDLYAIMLLCGTIDCTDRGVETKMWELYRDICWVNFSFSQGGGALHRRKGLTLNLLLSQRRQRKSWRSHVIFSEIGPYPSFFFSRGHHESVADLHPRFTADTSKTSAVTSRGSPSRKPSRFVASQLHLHLCIFCCAIFAHFAPDRPRGERRDTRYEKVWSHTEERKKVFWSHFEWKH